MRAILLAAALLIGGVNQPGRTHSARSEHQTIGNAAPPTQTLQGIAIGWSAPHTQRVSRARRCHEGRGRPHLFLRSKPISGRSIPMPIVYRRPVGWSIQSSYVKAKGQRCAYVGRETAHLLERRIALVSVDLTNPG